MGSLTYGDTVVQIEDRALTHLQIVIVNKLRKGEGFLVSWKDSPDVGDGRSSVWMHPYMLLQFKFDGSRVPAINQEWIDVLVESANSSRGLILTAEVGGSLARIEQQVKRGQRRTLAAPATSVEAESADPA